ncbi:MAG: LPS export ABC transporter permease LptG [Ahrensia sp.]|nr:LPS export ABC transporter permease LptG [Ahrensia sp.]
MSRATFSLYVAGHFLKNMVFVFVLFVFLIVAVDMIELSRDLSSVPEAGFSDVATIAMLRAPSFAENILPFATLFGAAGSLILLNRKLELVVARASGVSVWQFLMPMVVAAAIVGVLASLVYNPLSLAGVSASRAAESGAFGKVRGGFASRNDKFWLRVGRPDGGAVIRARVAENLGTKLTGVTVYTFGPDNIAEHRFDAATAEFQTDSALNNSFLLRDVIETIPGEKTRQMDQLRLPVSIDRSQLQANTTKPTETGFWDLVQRANESIQAGRSPLPFYTQYQSLIAQPFLFATMVLLAATFSLRFARFGQSGKAILGGILAGFVLYVITKLVLTFGSNGLVPPPVAAWTPAFVAALMSVTVLLYQEDG